MSTSDIVRKFMNKAETAPTGPMQIPLTLIEEDPSQPRSSDNPGFSEEALEELAATIRLRGVKTPISVRHHPRARGRYMINHGARRYRASKMAGKTTIPGFIDDDYDNADQVIENLHRNALTPREIADYIGRELSRGKKKGEIAKELGKSPAFVSQHVTLLDLPDPIAEAFNSGRSRDVTLINDMVTVYSRNPQEVTSWLADDTQEISRGSVKLLREFLEYKEGPEEDFIVVDEPAGGPDDNEEKSQKLDPNKIRRAILKVRYQGRAARLLLDRRPRREGFAWVRYDDDGKEAQAELANVRIVSLVEGHRPRQAKDGDGQ